MHRRNIEHAVLTALSDTPVVVLNGARQTGKSTLALKLGARLPAAYFSLDDATALAAATSDPTGIVRQSDKLVIIDEIQKAPGLFPAIKVQVDADRRPGRYLLTGSANVLMLPRLAESLAGRMQIITLWPLSQGELIEREERFLDGIFSGRLPPLKKPQPSDSDLGAVLMAGGFPEAVGRKIERRRSEWFGSYITAILQRDVRDLANIEGLTEMPRLLALLAARVSAMLNVSELSRASATPNTTLARYLTLLETTFMIQPLRAWSGNLGKRLIKSAKIHLVDSGMAAHLTGQTRERLIRDRNFLGGLLETFVVSELRKQAGWSDIAVSFYYFRTTAGREVDVVLEDSRGRVAGIEVKAAHSVTRKDFAGLDALAEAAGKKFLRGVVLYGGDKSIPFGDRYHALPVSALWRMTS